MNQEASRLDQELLAELGRIARVVDPAPPVVFEHARAAFTLRDLDTELASLVADSAYDLVAVRGPELNLRLLEFAVADLAIELQLSQGDDQRSLIGQIHSGSAGVEASVVAESSTGENATGAAVDQLGRFVLDDLPSGKIRLRFDRPGLAAVVTPWICP